jgi:hypothetical protein
MEKKESKENKIKVVGENRGFSIKKNGLVVLKIGCDGTQLTKVLPLLQYANEDFLVFAKTADGNITMGEFGFRNLSIDRDGETKIQLEADKSAVKMEGVETVYQIEELVTFVFCQLEKAD